VVAGIRDEVVAARLAWIENLNGDDFRMEQKARTSASAKGCCASAHFALTPPPTGFG
jgi:hypothetical protein